MLGYFIADLWTSPNGEHCHEIAINPTHMGSSRLYEVLQTLVHEMVHCWQHVYGKKPAKSYHDKQWAYKMMEIGLQPSTTGKPGGAITGVKMSDYIIEDGLFWRSCLRLISDGDFQLPWIYRLRAPLNPETTVNLTSMSPDTVHETSISEQKVAEPTLGGLDYLDVDKSLLYTSFQDLLPENTFYSPEPRPRSKSKYSCPVCGLNMWGRPNANVACMDCDVPLNEVK